MSDQRVCDLDGTIINPELDRFYSVTDGRTGVKKDICFPCARSAAGALTWAATMPLAVGTRIRGTTHEGWVFDVVTAGITDPVEPVWPTSVGSTVRDGEVVYRVALAPKDNATVHLDMAGATRTHVSLYGWMEGTGEPVS